MAKPNVGIFWPLFHNNRQLFGEKVDLGLRNELSYNLYKSMSTRKEYIWDNHIDRGQTCSSYTGSIFNVEYSPDGSSLLAATENKKILIFCAKSHKLLQEIPKAHKSCVNLIKFLDSRTFVTCSDDCSLGIWDLRKCDKKVKSLIGHKNWVKSVDYDSNNGVLLSAAYDQTVLRWDINSSCVSPQKVLQIKNMLRMVLTPDSNKMIISTADGYLLVIHDLDINKLSDDLEDFMPELYRLMQDNCNYGIDIGSWINHLFAAKRNRVELISDFPSEDKNGYITTLNVHPFGWSVLSRNTTEDDTSEWTCVHDIDDSIKPSHMKPIKKLSNDNESQISQESQLDSFDEVLRDSQLSDSSIIVISNQIGSTQPHTTVVHQSRHVSKNNGYVYENIPRLKYYIEELNQSHGFIKELCFSSDGRVICSPYHFGYRLLTFDDKCSEMSDCVSNEPKLLCKLKTNLSHPDYVVTTKFCPTHCQIASGCLKGRVVFSQPIL
ncbi:DDB1- and CUL4-associated factor 10-like [Oppia nitens]|uniref:DDB1- and CUL4-associated factor 10-like n=1 Tax=Oppia nitens TaxID=1686743 RepID=UPI0023DC0D5A|nr:DDB1- and CUL4-associated factor 10-like [Oppia nitens]